MLWTQYRYKFCLIFSSASAPIIRNNSISAKAQNKQVTVHPAQEAQEGGLK